MPAWDRRDAVPAGFFTRDSSVAVVVVERERVDRARRGPGLRRGGAFCRCGRMDNQLGGSAERGAYAVCDTVVAMVEPKDG